MATWSNIILSSFLTIYLFGLDKSSFSKKWDKELGDLSYPIYIIHWSGALLASWLLSSDGVKTSFVFILGLLITLTISFVINRYVSESVEKIRLLVKK
jgi:peptidoglycan/LPS O-acetylase OafA/YrhL